MIRQAFHHNALTNGTANLLAATSFVYGSANRVTLISTNASAVTYGYAYDVAGRVTLMRSAMLSSYQ